jgi:hypothetical protein
MLARFELGEDMKKTDIVDRSILMTRDNLYKTN